jgi:hypothetical protein
MPPSNQTVPNGAVPLPPQPVQQPIMPQPAVPQAKQVPLQTPAPPEQPLQQAPQPAQAEPAPAQEPLPRVKTAGPPPPPEQMNKDQSIKALKKAVSSSHEVLLSATTVFPFTLIPDTITLDREKLTVSNRMFFRIAEVSSIRIEDILNVVADVGPFFGSLKITTRFFDESEPHTVNYLWRSDALRFKRVLQGYVISRQKGIDSTAFKPKELVEMLDKLGQAAPDDPNDEA